MAILRRLLLPYQCCHQAFEHTLSEREALHGRAFCHVAQICRGHGQEYGMCAPKQYREVGFGGVISSGVHVVSKLPHGHASSV